MIVAHKIEFGKNTTPDRVNALSGVVFIHYFPVAL